MKRGLLFVVFSLWYACGKTQSLLPSTIREVFSFEVGDTFVYHHIFCPICQPQDRREEYFSIIILGKDSSLADTLLYNTNRGQMTLTDLDSLVIKEPLQPLNYFPPPHFTAYVYQLPFLLYDSTFLDTTCFVLKNSLAENPATLGTPQSIKYVDGLGLVEQHQATEANPLDLSSNWSLTMIYHNTRKGSCGTYPASVFLGTSNMKENPNFSLFPNPTSNILTIQSENNLPSQPYFQLFDITGRMILQQELTDKTNRIDVSAVSKGMYLYSVVTDKEKLGAGKVVIE